MSDDNFAFDHPLITGVAAGVGAGMFYKYATGKLFEGNQLPPHIKSELNDLRSLFEAFKSKADEDLGLQELKETIKTCSENEDPAGIIVYVEQRLEENRDALAEIKEIERGLFKVRNMTDGLSKSQHNQIAEGINTVYEFTQNFQAIFKLQRSLLHAIRDAYEHLDDGRKAAIPVATKERIKKTQS